MIERTWTREEWEQDETGKLMSLWECAAQNMFIYLYFAGDKGGTIHGAGFDPRWALPAVMRLIQLGLAYVRMNPKTGGMRYYSTVVEESHPVSPADIYTERAEAHRGN